MNRHACHHCGLDDKGDRHWRAKDINTMRQHRLCVVLFPRIVTAARTGAPRSVWRNALQQRRWLAVATVARAHRRSFQTTLRRPPLVSPIVSFRAL